MILKASLAGFLAIFIAYICSKFCFQSVVKTDILEKNIIDAWKQNIKAPNRKFQRLHAGINSNVDLIVSGVALLKELKINPGKIENKDFLQNLDDLQGSFTHFFAKGSAAERTFANEEVFRQIILVAQSLPNAQFYIGGNAALMATKVTENFPDVSINFVGPVGPKLLNLLPSSLSISTLSHIPLDEVHLIMEYGVGEVWGDYSAPVANRFITSYDHSNSKATMLESYLSSLQTGETDLAVISGLHMLESQPEDFYTDRLQVFTNGLQQIPMSLPVHLELASMVNEKFVLTVLQKVLPQISSLGLNEQELTFSSLVAGGPHKEDFHREGGQPEIHKISDIVLWLLKTYGHSEKHPENKLTRVHFHSLTFHIIGYLKTAWSNCEAAVSAGTYTAGKQACDVENLDTSLVDLKIPLKFRLHSGDREREFNSSNPVINYHREGFEFVFSPVLVCKEPQKTVGLGDSISATGLMYSEYKIVDK